MTRHWRSLLRRSRRADGFTLVEMLVGLTLFALLSVLLFGGFRFGLRAWEVGGKRAEQAGEVQLVQEMLRRQISAAQPAAALDVGTTRIGEVSFSGTGQSLTFVANLSVRTSAAGLYRFELGPSPEAGNNQLALTWSVFRPDQSSRPGQVETLLKDVEGYSFAYFGRAIPNEPAGWYDHWDDALGLPELVRLSVAFPSEDPRVWPDLFMAPRLRGAGR